jgi:hypothetical protein
MHGHRLSRQFHKTLDKLREIQTDVVKPRNAS